jgi:hypothetical protein
MSCFSFSQCIALSHAQYIYIYLHPPCSVYGLIGRRPSTYEYVYSFGSFTCYLFFSLCVQYTICQTSNCTIHTYICICTTHIYCFMMKEEVFEEREKDCSIIYYFFLSFFLSFSILAYCQLTEIYV